jgi:hypothetical protein
MLAYTQDLELHTHTRDTPTDEATTKVVNRGHGHKRDYVGEEEHALGGQGLSGWISS